MGAEGWSGVRLCTLGAQSSKNAERGVQAGGAGERTGRQTEPWEIIYSKFCRSHMLLENGLETDALMLGSHSSRGSLWHYVRTFCGGRSWSVEVQKARALDDLLASEA
jgi:hypothetical protein